MKLKLINNALKDQKNKLKFYNKKCIKNYIFEFDKNILQFITSNLAITRCGASSTAELVHTLNTFYSCAFPHSIDNHQYLNAKYYEKKAVADFRAEQF